MLATFFYKITRKKIDPSFCKKMNSPILHILIFYFENKFLDMFDCSQMNFLRENYFYREDEREFWEFIEPFTNLRMVQRLKLIEQHGILLIQPPHSYHRYDHSLFTAYISWYYCKIHNISDIKSIALASLFHDIGHFPLSHYFEHVVKRSGLIENTKLSNVESIHEYVGKKLLEKSNKKNIDGFRDLLDVHGIKFDHMMKYIRGGSEDITERSKFHIVKSGVKSNHHIDIDRLSYLMIDLFLFGKYIQENFSYDAALTEIMNALKHVKRPFPENNINLYREWLFERVYIENNRLFTAKFNIENHPMFQAYVKDAVKYCLDGSYDAIMTLPERFNVEIIPLLN